MLEYLRGVVPGLLPGVRRGRARSRDRGERPWASHRLVAIFQRAYSVDPADPGYRPATAGEFLAATARYA
jgi:hypothetical protein